MVYISTMVPVDDLPLLAALDALLSERHVTRAARRLGITQSSMSHHLARLRLRFGDALLVRSGRAMALTPRAEAMAAPLREALGAVRRAVADADPFDPATTSRTFTLAMPDLLAPALPDLLAAMNAAAPDAGLHTLAQPVDTPASLASGACELLLGATPASAPGVVLKRLGAIRWCVLARRGHPVLAGRLTAAAWERYPHVEVEVAYADPANQIAQSDVLLLSSEKTEALWNMFVRDPQRTGFRYRVTHRALDQRDHQTAWIETDEERINIRDPFPNGRVLDVVPVLDWTVVKRAFVDLSYRDDPNGILEEDSMEFTKETDQTQQFRVRLADVTQREVGYRVTLINLDGSVVEIPPSVTLERRVTLRGDMAGHRVIRIRSQAVDYAAVKVRQVSVDLRYLDAAHGLQVFDNVVLRSGADEATFEFDYVADGPAGFEYQVVTTFTNNLTRTRPWAPADESRLVIAVP